MPGRSSTKFAMIVGVAFLVIVMVVGSVLVSSRGSTSTTLSPAEQVLSPSYAKSLGYPKVLQKAKKSSVSGEKGCTSSVEAVYEDPAGKSALISDVLNCKSAATASSALAAARKEVTLDSSVAVPSELGHTAFATASRAPQYLLVWQSGTRVAITSIDVDVSPSSSSSTTSTASTAAAPTPMTAAQKQELVNASIEQNILYR
jgi:hypothetical protein